VDSLGKYTRHGTLEVLIRIPQMADMKMQSHHKRRDRTIRNSEQIYRIRTVPPEGMTIPSHPGVLPCIHAGSFPAIARHIEFCFSVARQYVTTDAMHGDRAWFTNPDIGIR
jgi:hypothetical protein